MEIVKPKLSLDGQIEHLKVVVLFTGLVLMVV